MQLASLNSDVLMPVPRWVQTDQRSKPNSYTCLSLHWQGNPNDTMSQGCVNLVTAILGMFCSGNKTKT